MSLEYCDICGEILCKCLDIGHTPTGINDQHFIPVEVSKLSSVTDDAKVRSLIDALESSIDKVKQDHSDCITLLEVTKHTMLDDMSES